jgi:hypothetical protein
VKLCTAGDIGSGGSWDGLGKAGIGGGASEVVRMLQMELRLLRTLVAEIEFFLLDVPGKMGGVFMEKPDRVRPLFSPASHVAAF